MKCPKCGAEINHLKAFSTEENMQPVSLDETGELDWGSVETVDGSCTKIDFACPECLEVLYSNAGYSTDPKIKQLLRGDAK